MVITVVVRNRIDKVNVVVLERVKVMHVVRVVKAHVFMLKLVSQPIAYKLFEWHKIRMDFF